jgi:S-formylglutathione hydrolase FrmB
LGSAKLEEFLIVTPQGGASFYVNSRDGRQRYEDFFLQEFLPNIEQRYRIEPGRKSRAIGGISMGDTEPCTWRLVIRTCSGP